MASPLVTRLSALPPSSIGTSPGATDEQIAAIETQNGITLPDDLRDVLRFSNGLSLKGGGTALAMYDAAELQWTSSEDQFREDLGGMLILGTDGEGGVFYTDPRDKIGRGAFAVYHVRMSALDVPSSVFVGDSFTAAIETILAGTDLYGLPKLRAQGTSS